MRELKAFFVYLDVPNGIAEEIQAWKSKYKTFLDEPQYDLHPHISLMYVIGDATVEDVVTLDLRSIAHEEICLRITEPRIFNKRCIVARVEGRGLKALHKKVAKLLSPYIEQKLGFPEKYMDRKETYEKYGSPFFGDYFNPHITLGYVHERAQPATMPDIFGEHYCTEELHLGSRNTKERLYDHIETIQFTR